MIPPKLYTDKILGNAFEISPLPGRGFSIVSYNGKRRIVVKRIFRAHLVDAEREIKITYIGLLGIKKFTFRLEGELLKFQFIENHELTIPQKFTQWSGDFRCLLTSLRTAQNETKLLHKPYRIQRDQVRLRPLEPKLKSKSQIPNFIQEQ